MTDKRTGDERLEELLEFGLTVKNEESRSAINGELIEIYADGKEVVNIHSSLDGFGTDMWKEEVALLGELSRSKPNVNLEKLEADLANNRIEREHRIIYENDGAMWTFNYPSRRYLKD